MDRDKPRISVIGLGKIGAPLAACLAASGHEVIGVDKDPSRFRLFDSPDDPDVEPDLADIVRRAAKHFDFTPDVPSAVSATDVTFIVVFTPTDTTGTFSDGNLLEVCGAVGSALKGKAGRHLVVVASTVTPGTVGGSVRQVLEEHSELRCGEEFGLCYCPEFVALGDTVRGYLNPDFVVIGESDARSGAELADIYHEMCRNNPPVVRMSFLNAELVKLAVNTYVCTKITFANTLLRLCEEMPGANVDTVTQAMGLDKRIGRAYLKGATPYGGPCFPRDVGCMRAVLRDLSVPSELLDVLDVLNSNLHEHLAHRVVESLRDKDDTVAVLGLSFKPGTSSLDGSAGLDLARRLLMQGIRVIGHDPLVAEVGTGGFASDLPCLSSLRECLVAADVVVVATPCEEFLMIPELISSMPGPPHTVIDCWRLLDGEQVDPTTRYVAMGIGPMPRDAQPAGHGND